MQLPLLREVTLEELNHGLDDGSFTSVDLVKVYGARISEVDGTYRSILEVNRDSIFIAKKLNDERQRNGQRG